MAFQGEPREFFIGGCETCMTLSMLGPGRTTCLYCSRELTLYVPLQRMEEGVPGAATSGFSTPTPPSAVPAAEPVAIGVTCPYCTGQIELTPSEDSIGVKAIGTTPAVLTGAPQIDDAPTGPLAEVAIEVMRYVANRDTAAGGIVSALVALGVNEEEAASGVALLSMFRDPLNRIELPPDPEDDEDEDDFEERALTRNPRPLDTQPEAVVESA